MNILIWILSAVIAYLIGSVSFGLLLAKAAGGPDPRTVGSKSTGASNIQRTLGWKYGLLTLLGDAAKAALACWIGSLLTGNHMGALLCGLCAVIGHNWPIFFGFRGGKGVASSCGAMLFCYPVPALICFALTIALIAIIRYISVGSMFMVTLYAVIVSVWYSGGNPWVIAWTIVMALLVYVRHHANIRRLMNGTENRLSLKSKKTAPEEKK